MVRRARAERSYAARMTTVVRQVLTALLILSLASFSVLGFLDQDLALYAAVTAAASMIALCVLASGAGRGDAGDP